MKVDAKIERFSVQIFFEAQPLQNFCYVITQLLPSGLHRTLLDPHAWLGANWVSTVPGNIDKIFLTHLHSDHFSGIKNILSSHPQVPIILGGSLLDLTPLQWEVISTPGHCMEHSTYILKDQDQKVAAFTGDLLFQGGVGNTKDATGNLKDHFHSLKKLLVTLEDETIIYPGHDYLVKNLAFARVFAPSERVERMWEKFGTKELGEFVAISFGEEKKYNPYLQIIQQTHKSEDEVFAEFCNLRRKRDQWMGK